MKAIINADIIMEDGIVEGYSIIFNDKILNIVKGNELKMSEFEEIVDASGKYLSPGFIDVHIHGCLGNDTMDDNESSIGNISRGIAATGVTAFLPTTMTMKQSMIEKTLARIKEQANDSSGASVLGCHLEGPFISDAYKGAQDGRYIRRPDFKSIEGFLDIIRLITLAPEEEGSGEFIESCTRHGVVISIGHSRATYEQAMEAMSRGANHITHTFNGMPPLHHRTPGVLGAALDSSASCELIADNIHVAPAVQRILLKAKGIEKIILVTDAMRACLLDEGEYELGGQLVLVKNGEARLRAGNLAGSVLTMNRALKNFIENTGISLAEAVRAVSGNPAKLLKIDDRKGSIGIGKDADLTIFDKNFDIYGTFVGGKKVYEVSEQ